MKTKELFYLVGFGFSFLFAPAVSAQWTQKLTEQTSLINNISVVDNNIIWICDQDRKAVSISTDGGVSWTRNDLPAVMIEGSTGGICAVSATTAYMIVSMGQKGVYKTTDGAKNWTRQPTAFNNEYSFPNFVHFWNENEGVAVGDSYAGECFEIYTTNNGGVQWNLVPDANMPAGNGIATYNVNESYRVDGNTIYFKTNTGKILKSTDKGLHWTAINTPFTNANLSFDFKDELNGLALLYTAPGSSSLYSTSDGGANWTAINTNNYFGDLYYDHINGVYFSYHANYGMSYSKDNGQNWTVLPAFANFGIGAMATIASGKVIAGSWSYVFSATNYEITGIYVKSANITGKKSIELAFSEHPDAVSSLNADNYKVRYINNKIPTDVNISSVTQATSGADNVLITLSEDLPIDTIQVLASNVKDANGAAGLSIFDTRFVFHNNVKTLQSDMPGMLASLLSAAERENLLKLKVTGIIDARDFKTMRDLMPALGIIDLKEANILAYTGTEGTAPDDAAMVPARIKKQGRHIVPEGIETVTESAVRAVKAVDVTYPANEIPEDAFYSYVNDGKASLTSITLPATLGSIGREAFLNTGLTAITLPETVTSIGDWAFQGTRLQTITLPASVIDLGVNCFFDITTLQSITVSAANTAFTSTSGVLYNKNKSRLITYPVQRNQSSYTVPVGVEWIDYGAFYGNEYLMTVQLPSTLNGIGNYAFGGCYNLNSINFPSSLQYIGDAAFLGTNISNVDLSACNELTTIPGWAFQNSSISNLLLPASINTIQGYAFSICNNLTQVDWSGNTNLGTLENYVFWRCDNLNSVKLPRSVSSIGYGNFLSCYKLTDISVAPDNPYFAATDAVLMNKDYTSLIAYAPGKTANKYLVPATVTAIGSAAFRSCPNLTSVDAQNSHLASIGSSAFNNTPLTEITLPATVTTIGSSAFISCSHLSTFKIYNPVPPALGSNVFQGASTSSCKLYVPKGAKASYAAADQWNSFANTEEFIIDGVENPDMPGLIISQQGSLLRISGVAVGETLRIYGLSGQLIASRKAETAIVDISLPEKGVYVLQVGTKSKRIIFK